jgi:transcriptional regulator with XRE-family HTH domain
MNVDEILCSKGWTRRDLAEAVEMDESNLSKLLRNKNSPTLKKIQTIADALNVDISELFRVPELVAH